MPDVRTSFTATAPGSRIGAAPTVNGSASHTTAANGKRKRGRWWRVTRAGVTAKPKPPGWWHRLLGFLSRNGRRAPVDEDGSDGVYRLTRSTEEWFAEEAGRIEQEAIELAQAAAAANLPRLEVAYEEVEEEGALAARCRAALHGWAERVQTRVEDALQASTRRAGGQLREYEHEIGALDGALTELTHTTADLRNAENAAEAGQAYLEVGRSSRGGSTSC